MVQTVEGAASCMRMRDPRDNASRLKVVSSGATDGSGPPGRVYRNPSSPGLPAMIPAITLPWVLAPESVASQVDRKESATSCNAWTLR